MGFLSDVRRLNVAITRAKRALWILGSAATLKGDPVWAALIKCAATPGYLHLHPCAQPMWAFPVKLPEMLLLASRFQSLTVCRAFLTGLWLLSCDRAGVRQRLLSSNGMHFAASDKRCACIEGMRRRGGRWYQTPARRTGFRSSRSSRGRCCRHHLRARCEVPLLPIKGCTTLLTPLRVALLSISWSLWWLSRSVG